MGANVTLKPVNLSAQIMSLQICTVLTPEVLKHPHTTRDAGFQTEY